MTETRISTTAPSGGVQAIGKSKECNLIVVRSVGHQGIGAAARSVAFLLITALFAVSPPQVSAATPDPVLEWIGVMNTTVLTARTAPNVTGRVVALVSASVFDAVNGIEPRFLPLHVRPDAPHDASQRAAAIQAAYAILMNLYGAQQGAILTSQHDASLAALASTEKPESIAAGVAWGQSVADAIWAWRLTDGFAPTPPPFFGVQSIAGTPNSLGFWRPTPPANASGATPQLATITPWVLTRPSQFRLPPPLALNSPEYAADLNEVREMGSLSSTSRSSEQTEVALFWALNTPLAWNRIAAQLSAARGLSLTENAHLFAVLNVTLADAITACWDSKYRDIFWRPVTAIRAGAAPGDPDADWRPLLDSLTGSIRLRIPRTVAPPRSSWLPHLERTPHSASPPRYVQALVPMRAFPRRSPKSPMRVSLAAFTSEAVAPAGIPWVDLSRIMYRDTQRGRAVTIKTNEKSKRKGLGYSMRLPGT